MAEQGTARTRGEEGRQPGTWPGLRDAKPKRSEEFGVGGDRAPSNSMFVKCRGRKIEGAERGPLVLQNVMPYIIRVRYIF